MTHEELYESKSQMKRVEILKAEEKQMTHEELLEILEHTAQDGMADEPILKALRAVVELHKPFQFEDGLDEYKPVCQHCQLGVVGDVYPCETIQAIEKELR